MPRAVWKGAVTFGLVTVPVNLYPATHRPAQLAFRLLHRKDQAPIDYRRFCTAEGVEVEWRDIVRGYEYDKGRFVVMSEADFARARVEATRTFEIRDFVPGQQIDFAHFEAPYWLEPTRQGRKAYALLRQALERSGRVGIGTFVMRQRESLAVLRPAGRALMLTTMRFADEIRGTEELDLPADGADQRQLDLALQLVDTLAADWKPERYRDTYRETLRGIIEQKLEGREIEAPGPAPRARVVDLMAALRASLRRPRPAARAGAGERPAGRPGRAEKTPAAPRRRAAGPRGPAGRARGSRARRAA